MYSVDVNLDGRYRVDINAGQSAPGGAYHLEMDSVRLFGPQQVRYPHPLLGLADSLF